METIKLLLAEDQTMIRKAMRNMLEENEQFNVVFEAANGQEVIDYLHRCGELPDIVLLDISMPVLDGIEVQKTIRSKYPKLKTLILTMHDEYTMMGRMCELGINGYVKKSADYSELERAILEIHTRESYFDPEVGAAMQRWHKASREGIPLIPELNEREQQILQLICKGNTTLEISEKLSIKHRTIDGYRNKLIEKTYCRNSAELVAFAIKHHLVKI